MRSVVNLCLPKLLHYDIGLYIILLLKHRLHHVGIPLIIHAVVGSLRPYVSLLSYTCHCCVRNTPSDWTAARYSHFLRLLMMGNALLWLTPDTEVINHDKSRVPYGFYRMVGAGGGGGV